MEEFYQGTWRKPLTRRKSLTNLSHNVVIEYTSPWTMNAQTTHFKQRWILFIYSSICLKHLRDIIVEIYLRSFSDRHTNNLKQYFFFFFRSSPINSTEIFCSGIYHIIRHWILYHRNFTVTELRYHEHLNTSMNAWFSNTAYMVHMIPIHWSQNHWKEFWWKSWNEIMVPMWYYNRPCYLRLLDYFVNSEQNR